MTSLDRTADAVLRRSSGSATARNSQYSRSSVVTSTRFRPRATVDIVAEQDSVLAVLVLHRMAATVPQSESFSAHSVLRQNSGSAAGANH